MGLFSAPRRLLAAIAAGAAARLHLDAGVNGTVASEPRPDVGDALRQAFETRLAGDVRRALGVFNRQQVSIEHRLMMRNDPDVAFGLALLRAPIINLQWAIEGRDEEIKAFVTEVMKVHYQKLAIAGSMAMHFGFQVLEKVWEPTVLEVDVPGPDGGAPRPRKFNAWSYRRFKAINPKTLTLLVDTERDEWAGVEQRVGGVTRRAGPERCVLWSFRAQEVFGHLAGYPITDQAHKPWWNKEVTELYTNRYYERRADPSYKARAAASIQRGERTEDGFKYMADQVLGLKDGSVIVLPDGVDPSTGKFLFDVDLMADDKRGDMFQARLDALSTQILRALWIPDKAGTSDGTGSLAMAQTHAETMAMGLQAVLNEWIDEVVNPQVVAPLVLYNFGEERLRASRTRLVGAGISAAMQGLMKELLLALLQTESLQADGVRTSLADRIDADAVAKQLNLPMRSQEELDQIAKEKEKAAAAAERAAGDAMRNAGAAGNDPEQGTGAGSGGPGQ